MNTMFSINRITLLTGIVAGLLFLSSCGSGDPEPVQETPVSVEAFTASLAPGFLSHSFPASIQSVNQANLSTIVMGTITAIEVNEGDTVKEGDIIARVKDDQIRAQQAQLQATLLQARAQYELTERNYNRIKNLHALDSATQSELDEIEAQYEMAKASIEALEASLGEVEEMLNYTLIRAPFDGIVSRKHMSAGDLASPGMPIVSVSGPDLLKLTANVPERLINRVENGASVTYSVTSAGITNANATLTSVNAAAGSGSRQFSVEAILSANEQSGSLRPGMYADLHIDLEDSPSLMIPQSALVHRGQLTGIYAISEDNRAVLRWIRTGRFYDDMIEVVSGLSEGERIVSTADENLRQGQPLQF